MNHLIRTVTAALVVGVCGASLASAQTQTSAPDDCMISGHAAGDVETATLRKAKKKRA